MLFFIVLIVSAQAWDKSEMARDLQSAEGQVKLFSQLMTAEGLDYPAAEKGMRFRNFRKSLKEVVKVNAEQDSFETTVNFMSPLTEEEKQQYYGINITAHPVGEWNEEPGQGSQGLMAGLQAGSADWKSKGAVTAVKNQGSCGSCWTFAGIASFEGHYKVKAGALKRFAEQEFLDCTYSTNKGCKGGWYWEAYDNTVAKTQHLATSADYPYNARDGACRTRSTRNGMTHAKCSGTYRVRRGSDASLATALNSGPVAMAFEIKHPFSQYKTGYLKIYSCGGTPHHAMAVVGYTSSYWDIKNSWGAHWGDRGYVKFDRRVNNMCGISNWAAYPKLTATGTDNSADDGGSDDGAACSDKSSDCPTWARSGYCKRTYVAYMKENCKKSCGLCGGDSRCSAGLTYCGGKCQHEHLCHGQ